MFGKEVADFEESTPIEIPCPICPKLNGFCENRP
jgi:hypothetical protein